MKKIVCEINLFDLHQRVFLINSETKEKKCIATVMIDSVPEAISALCNNQKVYSVTLTGNREYNNTLSKDILEYSRTHYNNNSIEIEVI